MLRTGRRFSGVNRQWKKGTESYFPYGAGLETITRRAVSFGGAAAWWRGVCDSLDFPQQCAERPPGTSRERTGGRTAGGG